jgi:hypothetical protein
MSTTTMTHQPCERCGAALDQHQRYCVECGTSRRHPGDPVAAWLADASARRAAPVAVAPAPDRNRVDTKWVAVALALVPVAAAIGVTTGRHGGGSSASDQQLLAALRAPTAGWSAAPTSASNAAIASDFTLTKGYVVQLRTLPGSGTDQAAVDKAKAAARSAGAPKVGVISPADFVLRPSSGGAYVIYSGQFRSRADAAKALSKLHRTFPSAKVVHVGTAASATAPKAGSASTTSGAVALQQHATTAQKQQGAKIVQQIQAQKGKSYVQQQRKLPDTIVVP